MACSSYLSVWIYVRGATLIGFSVYEHSIWNIFFYFSNVHILAIWKVAWLDFEIYANDFPNILVDGVILKLWQSSWILWNVHISAVRRAKMLKFRFRPSSFGPIIYLEFSCMTGCLLFSFCLIVCMCKFTSFLIK